MGKEEESNKFIQMCYDLLGDFTDVYGDNGQELPDDVKITVFCKGRHEEGFVFNTDTKNIGLEALIAKKWILHDDLIKKLGVDGSSFNSLEQ